MNTASLSDCVKTIVDNRGRTCPTAETGIPLIATNCIKEESIFPTFEKVRFVSKETYSSWFRGHPEPGDIIFVNKGSPGRVCLAPNPLNFCIAQDMVALRANEEVVDPKYLFAALRSKKVRGEIDNMHVGTMIPHFKKGDFDLLQIPLPEMEVQRFIGKIYFDLCSRILCNQRINETLEGIAKALFKSWFVDFDPVRAKAEGRSTGLPNEISELFPDSFEESELGEIPKGWSQTSIGKEANLLTGFPFKSALFANSPPGARLARGMNVKEGFLFWESQSRFWRGGTEEYKKYFLDVGDILIGMDGSKVGKNWVRVRASDLPCLLVQRVARLRHESSIGETFLRFLVGSAEFTAYVDLVKTGTSIPHISLKQIKEYAFTRPEKSDNRLFAAYEEISLPMMRKIDNNYAQSIVLSSLRDYLLPRLISGELRVPDAEKMLEEAGV